MTQKCKACSEEDPVTELGLCLPCFQFAKGQEFAAQRLSHPTASATKPPDGDRPYPFLLGYEDRMALAWDGSSRRRDSLVMERFAKFRDRERKGVKHPWDRPFGEPT